MSINVALDGPSGAGKSSIAKVVAHRLKYVYVDTGALYRAIALYMIRKNLDLTYSQSVIENLDNIKIELAYHDDSQVIFLNGEDVTDEIRTPEVSMGAATVSAIPEVRAFLLQLQRDIAKNKDVIMDGRDIGTVVLPDAKIKLYLTASAQKRAERRYKELVEKGVETTIDKVLEDIEARDYQDMNRDVSPLKKADGAIEINTSELDFDQSVEAILSEIKKITKKKMELKARPVTNKKKKNPIIMVLYSILRPIVYIVYKIAYNVKFEGTHNIPKDGGNIFASNHRSYADPVLIAIPTRVPFAFMAKEELFKNKIFGAIIKFFGAFPVSRGKGDSGAIDEAINRLEKGSNLVVFPEGTRSKDGTVGKGKTGVALIAAMAKVPVVPVGISFKNELKFRSKITVKFGAPIKCDDFISGDDIDPRQLRALKKKIMSEITDLVETDVNKM